MIRFPKTLLAAALVGFAAVTAPVQATDLVEVYRIALERDAQLRAAEAQFRAALEQRPQARSVLLPQIEGGVGYAYTDTERGGNSFDYQTSSFELSLNQTLYDHRNYVVLRQADLGIAQATAIRDASRQELILRVAEAYFNVLAAQDNLSFARAEKEAIGRQLEQADRRFEVGLIAITDVKEAQAQYDLAVAEEIAALNRLDLAGEELMVITGQFHEQLALLSERMPLVSPEPANMDQWVQTALEANLSLIARRFGTEVAAEEIKRQRAGHYPTLGLSAGYTDRDIHNAPGGETAGNLLDGRDTQIGIQLRVPLYTGGRTSSLTREARENFDAAREELELTERQTVRQARSAFLSVNAGISRVNALEQALESTRASFEAAEAGFEVGTRTAVDVLLELRQVFRAERDYAEVRYNYLLDTLRLKQAAGTLTENDLLTINTWLD
ncbi:TolC family outer membrane protein [Ectothiorhodospira lacustris]|uniref:TolC family outer membrane protein n=1 Tax=Ectothiorhodospira lacustris TaxID=2899127 RepID=UPI001EE852F4|nr:TolC family outer membrane protein [Ectothiorhodospira lacustris]MCG5500690.1 TolC family outer membrane protein [Ectothiorhodospira lacustris]MCG5509924.1 TolC family outer membrane protein [Ectothiorhodospira lacustris]MCG5521178.1 TolC family outer membrane protein [Ectothiorhodospira lacustris]